MAPRVASRSGTPSPVPGRTQLALPISYNQFSSVFEARKEQILVANHVRPRPDRSAHRDQRDECPADDRGGAPFGPCVGNDRLIRPVEDGVGGLYQ